MIRVTNDVKSFFEKDSGEIVIFGAGNAGYWIGYYMNCCNLQYEFYVDRFPGHDDSLFNGHRIYSIEILKKYSNKHIRIIISPRVYSDILAVLLFDEERLGIDALCYVPLSIDVTQGVKRYNINHFLGYFRRKLLVGDFPTIISNNCLAGFIYDAFDMPLLSPTINMGFEPEDYIRFVERFDHYISEEMIECGRTRFIEDSEHPLDLVTGLIDDVKAIFTSEDYPIEKWNLMRTRVNKKRVVFIMTNQLNEVHTIPISIIKRFKKLEQEHLYIDQYNGYLCDDENSVYMPKKYLNERESAIENYFDLLGWFNKGYE